MQIVDENSYSMPLYKRAISKDSSLHKVLCPKTIESSCHSKNQPADAFALEDSL